jgi:thioredoxin 1
MMETQERIPTVDAATFAPLVLSGAGPIVVEFMSYGCSHCRAMEPVLQEVAEQLASQERMFRVNVAVNEELANRYDIQATPTLVMFTNGEEIGRLEGPSPHADSLVAALRASFGS